MVSRVKAAQAELEQAYPLHQQGKTTLCSVGSVQLTTENYRKVPSNTELYRKWTKKTGL